MRVLVFGNQGCVVFKNKIKINLKIFGRVKNIVYFRKVNLFLQCQKTKDIAKLFLPEVYLPLALYLNYRLNTLRFFIRFFITWVSYSKNFVSKSIAILNTSFWHSLKLANQDLMNYLCVSVDSITGDANYCLFVWGKFKQLSCLLNFSN